VGLPGVEQIEFMNVSDELERLNNLHQNGALSDQEFAQAKSKLLGQKVGTGTAEVADNSTIWWIVIAVIGAIFLASLLFGFAAPRFHGGHHFFHW
jgi:hypothetical protein